MHALFVRVMLYEFKHRTKSSRASRKTFTAFGENAVTKRTAQKWFKEFASGSQTLEDAPRS